MYSGFRSIHFQLTDIFAIHLIKRERRERGDKKRIVLSDESHLYSTLNTWGTKQSLFI